MLMRLLKLFFSFKGTLNRPQYWTVIAPLWASNIIMVLHITVGGSFINEFPPKIADFIIKADGWLVDYAPNIILYMILHMWIKLAAVVRRLRDAKYSELFVVLALIPKVDVIFCLFLGFPKSAQQNS